MTPERLHLVESAKELRIHDDCEGMPAGVAARIGSTALSFKAPRTGSHRGEKMRYGNFSKDDRDLALLFVASPKLFAACERALDVLRVAVRSGLHGFTESETEEMVENHSTIQALKGAIALAKPDE